MKLKPIDIISGIIILGALSLLHRGIDTIVAWSMLVVITGYYGFDLTPWFKIGRNQKRRKEE